MSYGSEQKVLRYGSPQHGRMLEFIRSRRLASARKMREYHSRWDRCDDAFRAYQPTSEVDADRKAKRNAFGKHDYATITVPYTFAIIMTAHTYWTSVFLSRAPIYQLQGRHGETQDSIEAFEAALDYQRVVGEHLVPLYNWIFDMAKYEIGILGSYWDREETTISRIVEKPVTFMGIELSGRTQKVLETIPLTKYEGNCLFNVRPYDWFPDPRVAITSFQKGEFCGRDTQVGWHEILAGQQQGRYFNVEELAKKLATNSFESHEHSTAGSSRVVLPDQAGVVESAQSIPGPGFVNLHEMTVRLVPSVHGLSPVNRTEKWCFTVANGDVIIGAQPQALYHDRFPFDVMEYGFGAHEFLKMGLIEVMEPMVDTISWLVNSHFYNVRKALNDVRVVDPSRVVMKDVTSPIERGIIRLKPEAYGTDVRTAIHQLITPDMTRTHLQDMAILEQMLQRITGVVDEIMGLSGGGSRESATGVRTRTGFAANRLRTVAEYNSALGWSPLVSKMVANTQQFMTAEQKFRIAGADTLAPAKRFLDVNPDLIAGEYDYVPVDGTLPIDRLAQANFWKELTIQSAQVPMLAQRLDYLEMIGHIMRLQGEKNFNRFRLDLRSPADIATAVQQGNLVPMEEAGGGGQGAIPGGASGGTL